MGAISYLERMMLDLAEDELERRGPGAERVALQGVVVGRLHHSDVLARQRLLGEGRLLV